MKSRRRPKRFIQLFLCMIFCSVISAKEFSNGAFTQNTVFYTNPQNMNQAFLEGWCKDGTGEGQFYFAEKDASYPDPETGELISGKSLSLLNVKGLNGVKGAVLTLSGVDQINVCFKSGSNISRYIRADLSGPDNKQISISASNDGLSTASILELPNLEKTSQYKLVLSGWSDETCTSAADCQIIYLHFIVRDQTGKAKVSYIYDGSYTTYTGLLNDPVYTELNKHYVVSAFDVCNYNSPAGATYVSHLYDSDLVVLSEAIPGTHPFGIACKELIGNIPVLNLKAFFYSSGRWNWATPVNPGKGTTGWNAVSVMGEAVNHPIFRGMDLQNEYRLNLFDGTRPDANNVQTYINPESIIVDDTVLAYNVATGNAAIHERKQADGRNSYLLIPLSYDAISTLTKDAKTLILNAAEALVATKGEISLPVKLQKPVITRTGNMISIASDEANSTIYYALNASATAAGNYRYEGEFEIKSTTTISAVAVAQGFRSSEESSLDVEVENPIIIGKPVLLDPERLDRGLIAYPIDKGTLISWRLLGTDSLYTTTFNIYRDGERINEKPLNRATNYLDEAGKSGSSYRLETLAEGVTKEYSSSVVSWENAYLTINLDRPANGFNLSGDYEYIPGDICAADVDGDGEYELIMKWDPSNQKDNSLRGYTANVLIDCYKLNGTKLWRIDLGQNIRAGAHYTQLMVYDLDQDGKAEVACKTAPGTIDGTGKYVLMNNDEPQKAYLGTSGATTGVVTGGPEYLTVFNGESGAEVTTIAYEPSRGASTSWGKDSYFNRSERYLACIAYLDGVRPSLVMCRGYYQRAAVVAYDFNGSILTKRWMRDDKEDRKGCYGEGAHSIAVGDVDADGCDEVIFGSACIDHDGSMLYRTDFGHGDALHLGDLNPDRPGLEIFMVHEETGSRYPWDAEMRDAGTGKVIWGIKQTGKDIGRGLCADIDSTRRGAESWPISDYTSGTGVNNVFDCMGNIVSTRRPSVNFRVYWMDNLYEQVLEEGKLDRWNNTETGGSTNLINFVNTYGCGVNLIKNTPLLQADILGDWREEIIYYDAATKSKLMIFPTQFITQYRIPCLMHDHLYRMSICWQNVAYNQPPHTGYYLPDYGRYVAENIDRIETSALTTVQDAPAFTIDCSNMRQGDLRVTVKGLQTDDMTIRLINLAGIVLDRKMSTGKECEEFRFNGSHRLPDGVYLISVTSAGKTSIKRIVK